MEANGATRFGHCFVVTYGRSGSTLLQGVLNSIDGCLIRGENGGILNTLFRLFNLAEECKRKFSTIGVHTHQPWYGVNLIEREQLLADLRKVFVDNFIRPEPHHLCIGCKEIRWGPKQVPDLGRMIDFLEETFPQACIIFNSRDLEAVARSSFWTEEPSAMEQLVEFEGRMRTVYERGRDNYFWVRYDDYVHNPEALRPLFDFLGEPLRIEVVEKMLGIIHSTATSELPTSQ